MSLYLTGDVHADIISRFGFKHNPVLRQLSSEDTIIVLGDWGVPWNNATASSDRGKAKFIDEKPWTTIALRGNHDNTNLLREMPQEEKLGGKVRRLTIKSPGKTYQCDHVFIVDEPTILTIEGLKCLCIPGAQSHDLYPDDTNPTGLTLIDPDIDPSWKRRVSRYKSNYKWYRVKNKSWWADEDIDIEKCQELLKNNNQHFNLILSHDYPAIINKVYKKQGYPGRLKSTEGQEYLETLRNSLSFDSWIHGHLHAETANLCSLDSRLLCLYHDIIEVN